MTTLFQRRAFLICGLYHIAVAGVHSENPPKQLCFYVVHSEPAADRRYFDSPDFPKLGYIAARPDLALTRLEEITIGGSKQQPTVREPSAGEQERDDEPHTVILKLTAKDARELERLTTANLGKQLLLMLDDRPLTAPYIRNKSDTQSVQVTLPKEVDVDKLKRVLENLVPRHQ